MKRPNISKEKIEKGKAVGIRLILTLLSVVLGLLIAAQWKTPPTRVTDPIAPYASLKETRESLVQDQGQLKQEIKNLQSNIEKAQNESQDATLSKAEIENLNLSKARAGLTKLNGRGVIITLDDDKTASTSEDSIVHAGDLRDLVNLLWSSGAEGISINGQRIVINTAIDCIVNTIMVNNVRLSTPFRIEAIGQQDTLFDRISNPANLQNLYQRKSLGLIFNVEKNNDITLPIFDGSFEVKTEAN